MFQISLENILFKGPNKVSKVIVQANDSPYGVVLWEKESIVLPEPDGTDFTQEVYITRQQGMMGQLQVAFRYVDHCYKYYGKDIQIYVICNCLNSIETKYTVQYCECTKAGPRWSLASVICILMFAGSVVHVVVNYIDYHFCFNFHFQ